MHSSAARDAVLGRVAGHPARGWRFGDAAVMWLGDRALRLIGRRSGEEDGVETVVVVVAAAERAGDDRLVTRQRVDLHRHRSVRLPSLTSGVT